MIYIIQRNMYTVIWLILQKTHYPSCRRPAPKQTLPRLITQANIERRFFASENNAGAAAVIFK